MTVRQLTLARRPPTGGGDQDAPNQAHIHPYKESFDVVVEQFIDIELLAALEPGPTDANVQLRPGGAHRASGHQYESNKYGESA